MAWQLVLTAVFAALAVTAVRLYIRSRNGLSQYLVVMFCAIALVELWASAWLVVGEVDRSVLAYQVGTRSVYLLLILYPWALYRFAAKASGRSSVTGRVLSNAVLVPLAVFVIFAPYPVQPISATYQTIIYVFQLAVTCQFLVSTGVAIAKLWRAAHDQPTIVGNRLRVMSVAAAFLAVALILGQFGGPVAARSPATEWAFGVCALAAAIGFYVCMAPPSFLRVYWSYSAVRAVRTVMREIMQAGSRQEAVTMALPIMAEVTGSDRVEAYDSSGALLATWSTPSDHPELTGAHAQSIVVPMESEGEIVLHTNALWPFVGIEETDLLNYVASSVGLALNRRKLDAANAQLQVQSAVERSLRVQAKELELANRELNEFVAVASHDLQTPVRNIIDNIEFLNEDIVDDSVLSEEARKDLQYIEAGAYRIKNLIDGLLHYTRIDSLESRTVENVDLNEVVRQVHVSLADEFDSIGARLDIASLPSVAGSFSEVGEVMSNIFENSYKYRSADRPLRISVWSTMGPTGSVEIFIGDNGIGIEPEFRERVFEMFKRLHRHEDIAGTGIGLAVCRKIVERMGGHITFIEPPDHVGSTVKITLPAVARANLGSVA